MGAEDLFAQSGAQVIQMNDLECIQMMEEFTRQHPDLWNEDIGR
jgi:creatinine deaminase